jgi:hypothetical protein
MKKSAAKHFTPGLFLLTVVILFYVDRALSVETPSEREHSYTLSDFITQFHFEKDESFQDTAFLRQKDANTYIKIKQLNRISFEHANSYFSDEVFSITSLYRDAHSPYPGALSNRINCPDEFKPQEIKRASLNYYMLYANQRFNYGVCLWDLIEYKALLYPLYCPKNKQFIQIELFIPKLEDMSIYREALERLNCQ